MTETLKRTTICLDLADALVYREFSERTSTDLIQIFKMFAKELKKALDDKDEEKRILFMFDYDLKNSMIHLRLSNSFLGVGSLDALGLPREEIEKAFGYVRDPKTNAIIDTTEKPNPDSKNKLCLWKTESEKS